jgi:hypothetical protein
MRVGSAVSDLAELGWFDAEAAQIPCAGLAPAFDCRRHCYGAAKHSEDTAQP